MPKTKLMMMPLDRLKVDGDTQPRCVMDLQLAHEYAADLRRGAEFPPVTVFFDETTFWLADGHARPRAHQLAGRSHIACLVHDGGWAAARLHAAGTNAAHGQRRSVADKRRAVWMVLQHDEASKWTTAAVA